MIAAAPSRPDTLAAVRREVRRLCESSPGWQGAAPDERKRLAENLVNVSMMAADLMAVEQRATDGARARRPLAHAQAAGDQLGLQATRAAAGTLAAVRDSIDFPTFVTSLINGVFQAILSSSTSQVGAIGELLDNVSASADDFADTLSDEEVARWTVGKFPSLLQLQAQGIALKPGVDLADHLAELRAGLGPGSDASGVDGSDLEGTLLPLCRAAMARNKQQVLASMVQMGLQRIVVDEGRIHASMDMRVDASSTSAEDKAQRDDWRVNAGASGSFGYGPWSASASASTSVGQVKSDHQLTSEQIGVRAGLRSSVDLAFRTEQVPLDTVADANQRVRIANNARVPADVSGASTLPGTPANFNTIGVDGVPATPAAPTGPSASDARAARDQSARLAQGGQRQQQPQQPRAQPSSPPAQPPASSTPSQPPASSTPSQPPASSTPSQPPQPSTSGGSASGGGSTTGGNASGGGASGGNTSGGGASATGGGSATAQSGAGLTGNLGTNSSGNPTGQLGVHF
jgi:hypothetical protein